MYNLSKKKIIIFLLFITTTTILIFALNKDNNLFLKKIGLENINTNATNNDSSILSFSSSTKMEAEMVATTTIVGTTTVGIISDVKVEKKQIITKKIIPISTQDKIVVTNKISINPVKENIKVAETETIDNSTNTCNQANGGFAGQVESEINFVRVSYGLSKLIICKELRNSSYQKYLDIVSQNNFTHEWVGNKKLYDVIVSNGYIPKKWGEILEYGSDFTTAKDHVDNWMSSPAHKSIILDPNYTHFGVYVGGWNVEDISVDMGVAHFGKK